MVSCRLGVPVLQCRRSRLTAVCFIGGKVVQLRMRAPRVVEVDPRPDPLFRLGSLPEQPRPRFLQPSLRWGPKRASGSNMSRVLWSLAKINGPPQPFDIVGDFTREAMSMSSGKYGFLQLFWIVMRPRNLLRVHHVCRQRISLLPSQNG